MIAMERFRLLAIGTDETSDEMAESAFLNLEVETEAELEEALAILRNYRPAVYQKLQEELWKRPSVPFYHDG